MSESITTMLLSVEEYEKVVRRPYPPLILPSLFLGQMNSRCLQFGAHRISPLANMLGIDGDLYYAKQEIEKVGLELFSILTTPGQLNIVQLEFEDRERILLEAATHQVNFHIFEDKLQNYCPALGIIFCQDKFEDLIKQELSKKINETKVAEIMNLLNVPLRANVHRQEELDLLSAEDLADHIDKYKWFGVRYGEDNEYGLNEAQSKKKKIDASSFFQEYLELKNKVENSINDAKNILKNKEYLVDVIQWLVWFRTQRTDVINKATALYLPKYKAIAEDCGLTYQELLHVTRDELVENQIPPKKILNERQQGWAYYISDVENRACVAGQGYMDIKKYMHFELGSVKQIKGSIANKGLVTGRVRLVMDLSKLDMLEKGDILVTSMTTPNMINAMKRAAAFVTDEGGITCHAAVLSREMNKPCIIGTKVATKVLKDGDMVEVYADNGIVRIIA